MGQGNPSWTGRWQAPYFPSSSGFPDPGSGVGGAASAFFFPLGGGVQKNQRRVSWFETPGPSDLGDFNLAIRSRPSSWLPQASMEPGEHAGLAWLLFGDRTASKLSTRAGISRRVFGHQIETSPEEKFDYSACIRVLGALGVVNEASAQERPRLDALDLCCAGG